MFGRINSRLKGFIKGKSDDGEGSIEDAAARGPRKGTKQSRKLSKRFGAGTSVYSLPATSFGSDREIAGRIPVAGQTYSRGSAYGTANYSRASFLSYAGSESTEIGGIRPYSAGYSPSQPYLPYKAPTTTILETPESPIFRKRSSRNTLKRNFYENAEDTPIQSTPLQQIPEFYQPSLLDYGRSTPTPSPPLSPDYPITSVRRKPVPPFEEEIPLDVFQPNPNNPFVPYRPHSAPSPQHSAPRACVICQDSLEEDNTPIYITERCTHDADTCIVCLRHWMNTCLDEKGWNSISCPQDGCGKKFTHEDVKLHADTDTFERYDTLAARAAFGDIPDFFWCLKRGCSSGQIHTTGTDGPIFRCVACGYKVCVIHKQIWHEGYTCEEFDYKFSSQRRQEESASESFKAKNSKPCPRCRARIEKDDGCDHMTCRNQGCGYEFCWLCFADYETIRSAGNKAHKSSCKYYA